MKKINEWAKGIKHGITLSIAWIIMGIATSLFMYHKTNLNMLGWTLLASGPVIIGWLGAYIIHQANLNEDGWSFSTLKILMVPFVILLLVLQALLPFLLGIGLIWLFGWTYGLILASIILIILYGFWGPIAIYILSILYKFLIG